jgi:hypothetical protein
MVTSRRKGVPYPKSEFDRPCVLWVATLVLASAAWAQSSTRPPTRGGVDTVPASQVWPTYVIPGAPEVSTLYADGSEIIVETGECWRLMCSSNLAGVSAADLRRWAANHAAVMSAGPVEVVGNSERTLGLNVVFNVSGSPPPGTTAALGVVSTFLSGIFSDPITVTINLSFQDMGGGGVIGATSANSVSNVSYANSRTALINGMDSDDVIQTWPPAGTTVPVRYDGASPNVTNEGYVDWTRANYRATVGTISGPDASMTFNTQFSFDFDPSNGISGGTMSFVDVALHETGHALGFISGADGFGSFSFTSLDLVRFQRTDGCCNYNPDSYDQFQTTPRLVSYNSPDDDHNSDIITNEYRMSDGTPYQASHFREQSSPWIGLMDPAFALGETHYPNYFSMADLNMFDAIGYDYPPCDVPQFTQQPQSQSGCVGATVQMCVAVNIPAPAYQWRIGTNNLSDDGVHISGATTACLTIIGLTLADVSDQYNCIVTNAADGCVATSNNATVGVYTPVMITGQPTDRTIVESDNVLFTVTASGASPISYHWRHKGVNLTNGGNIYGATTATLVIISAQAKQAGFYDVVVTNLCGPVTSSAAHLTVNTGYGAGAGDLNCDGTLDFGDINGFVLALSSGEGAYYIQFPDCHWYNADINADGNVDFGDINPFVALLSGP